jgi:hypothetical protein
VFGGFYSLLLFFAMLWYPRVGVWLFFDASLFGVFCLVSGLF